MKACSGVHPLRSTIPDTTAQHQHQQHPNRRHSSDPHTLHIRSRTTLAAASIDEEPWHHPSRSDAHDSLTASTRKYWLSMEEHNSRSKIPHGRSSQRSRPAPHSATSATGLHTALTSTHPSPSIICTTITQKKRRKQHHDRRKRAQTCNVRTAIQHRRHHIESGNAGLLSLLAHTSAHLASAPHTASHVIT